MKRIIDGHKYDTETAREVGSWMSGDDPRDFDWESGVLYRTKAGLYFIHGSGGAMTRYAEQRIGGWAGGEAITPVSADEARQWAEEHLDADEYEAEFGEVDDDDVHPINIRMPESTWRALRDEAASRGVSVNTIAVEMLAPRDGA